jgi:hypothetical protein
LSASTYTGAELKERFTEVLRHYFAFERPVAITEFGCCTYRGRGRCRGQGIRHPRHLRPAKPARHRGSTADTSATKPSRPANSPELLSIFDAAGVDATFVMTFAAPLNLTSDDPLSDLDVASYSLVKSFDSRLGPLGAAHPETPWEHSRLGTT